MLQQTTVAAVVPYFERWMVQFPTVAALSAADEEAVLAAWQGLGYYRRARNLLSAARAVVSNGWPTDLAGWQELPGVGKYTAGAVCSICYGLRVPAVDGNVERVYARLTADSSLDLKGGATVWASRMVACERPGDMNQALMDLGATVCRPKSPDCPVCPVRRFCSALASGKQGSLPVPKQRRAPIQLNHDYVVPCRNGRIGVRQFGQEEWWAGMYGFALSNGGRNGTDLGAFTHTVTHHKITASATLVNVKQMEETLEWKTASELESLPMPAPHRKILNRALAAIQGSGSKPTGTTKLPSSAKK